MNEENTTPLTLDEWRSKTANLARKVADNIDAVMAGRGFDSINTLPTLKKVLSQLDELNIRPDNQEFDEKINILNDQKMGGVNTKTIREIADYLSPLESKTK